MMSTPGYTRYHRLWTRNVRDVYIDWSDMILLTRPILSSAERRQANGFEVQERMQLFEEHIANCSVDAIRKMLKAGKVNVNGYFDSGNTPLHRAAELKGETGTEILKLLLRHGAEPNIFDTLRGLTPLHVAAMKGNAPSVRSLMAAGADRTLLTDALSRRTALHYAVESDDGATVRSLVDNSSSSLLGVNKEEKQKKLQDFIDVQDIDGKTALSLACIEGNTDIVHLLLKAGASKNVVDSSGRTVLDIAVAMDKPAIIRLLQ